MSATRVDRVLAMAAPEWVCEDPYCGCGGDDGGYPRDNLGGLLRLAPRALTADLPPWDVSPHLFEEKAP